MKASNKTLLLFALLVFSNVVKPLNALSQKFVVEKIIYNGDPDKLINIVFLSDGYQESQMSLYTTHVKNTADYLFNISPFSEYKNYFNVFAIKVLSSNSGADHPRTAPDCPNPSQHPSLSVNTYFNSTFDYFSIHRLLVPTNSFAINQVIINNFPLTDQTLMLVNTPFYGGSGGQIATASLDLASKEVMAHEIAHSFANLADEYYAGDFYAGERANMTSETNPAFVKWKDWLGYKGVGIYQHCCGGNAPLWYKPHLNCKMNYLYADFCPVCTEAIVEKIHERLGSPIVSYNPTQALINVGDQPLEFEISILKPIPNTLKVEWKLNGNTIARNRDFITVNSSLLKPGNNSLMVQVIDTTALIRTDLHKANHIYNRNWQIDNTPLPVTWLSFTGRASRDGAYLNWATATETNAAFFKVERSFNGKDFEEIGQIKAAGNSQTKQNYFYYDPGIISLASDMFYYRLNQLNLNNSQSFSKIIPVKKEKSGVTAVFPNPFNKTITILLASPATAASDQVALTTMDGRVLYAKSLKEYNSATILLNDLPALTPGIYGLKIIQDNQVSVFKLIGK